MLTMSCKDFSVSREDDGSEIVLRLVHDGEGLWAQLHMNRTNVREELRYLIPVCQLRLIWSRDRGCWTGSDEIRKAVASKLYSAMKIAVESWSGWETFDQDLKEFHAVASVMDS